MMTKLLGLGLLSVGLLVGFILWLLQKSPSKTSDSGKISRYRLSHEFEKKGLTEKAQSEGMRDIPQTSYQARHEQYKNDPFFTSTPDVPKDTPPRDSF